MPVFEIPLSPEPQQMEVSLAGQMYTLRFRWNDFEELWVMDMGRAETGEMLLASIPLVTGVNLLEQYGHLGIGGRLEVYNKLSNAPPSYDDLGLTSGLLFITEAVS